MTITIEIDKDQDASELKAYLSRSGFKFDVDEDGTFPDELRSILDDRYNDYLSGKVKMVTPEESRRQIDELLSRKFK